VGDALARVLEAAGAVVSREFYINDRGSQMDKFGDSILARAQGTEPPEDGYLGEYVHDLAREVVAANPGILELPEAERREWFREEGYRIQLANQQDELAEFHTVFDTWFSERDLHGGFEARARGALAPQPPNGDGLAPQPPNDVVETLEKLRGEGHLYDADGALWMRTTDFGDDKDRVLIRSNGELTYFASDTAYYLDKRSRGFDRCIYLLGADHHGYVGRLRAMAACAGDDPDANIEVLIGQLVTILENGEQLKLSKRAGTIVSLRELMDLIGVDALRYTLARYPADSPLTLDAAEMTRQASDNPVFYVQYAHARVSSILRNAADLGLTGSRHGSLALAGSTTESSLVTQLAEFPRVVQAAATLREPHRVARYLEETAASYHRFYDSCRVLPRGDEEPTPLTTARLWLCAATAQVLRNGLDVLGVHAPERM
jgi:arginyl-tRNA synthetase